MSYAVGPGDLVYDLGSGDGRNVIAAARRGADALGVEYNPDMVALSKQWADEAGVSRRAKFVQGDMYAADISKATVMALFLLTPIVWDAANAPSGTLHGALMRGNPLFHMIEPVRAPLLGQPVEPLTYMYLGTLGVVSLLVAMLAYQRFARRVPVWL